MRHALRDMLVRVAPRAQVLILVSNSRPLCSGRERNWIIVAPAVSSVKNATDDLIDRTVYIYIMLHTGWTRTSKNAEKNSKQVRTWM